MRRLTAKRTQRDERGVAAVMVAMMATMLLAATGLGVDTGNLVYERSRVQHSADAAALAIAYDCALGAPECASAAATANELADENSPGSDDPTYSPNPVSQASGTVTVFVDENVPTRFFAAFGTTSKDVDAQATAIWGNHPSSGPVLPFAVSMCEYAKTPVGKETVIRTDINDEAKFTIVPNGQTEATKAYANMEQFLVSPACDVPDDVTLPLSPSVVTMLEGGLWLSDAGNSLCSGKLLSTEILQSLESVTAYNENCATKFAEYLGSGKNLFFAIYAPTANYEHAGLRLTGTNAVHPAAFDMKLVGYAPFVVSGWCLGVKPSGSLSSCGGATPGSVGIAGKFVSTIQQDLDFEYDAAGTNFGAVEVKLFD